MNCKKCNAILTENDQFCKNCGTPVNGVNTQQNQMENQQLMNQNYGQPMQQTYGNSINYNHPPQKVNTAKYVVFAIFGVVAIIVIVVLIAIFARNNNSSNLPGGSSNSGITQTEGSKATYKVNFKGFEFSIPDNLLYQEDSGVLMIGDEEGTWMAQIEIEEGSFAQIKANKSQLQAMMQQSGYTSSIAQEKTLGGVEFITLEISYGGQNAIAALTKANSMYFMGVTAMNLDNEFNYSLLETIAPIISSASYSGTTSNMEIGTKLDMNKIAEIAK